MIDQEHRSMKIKTVVAVLFTLVAGAVLAPGAWAAGGTYDVYACNGDGRYESWALEFLTGATDGKADCAFGVTPTDSGLSLYTTADANTPGPLDSYGRFLFAAPAGTTIARIQGDARASAAGGWTSGIYDYSQSRWLWCGPGCGGSGGWQTFEINDVRSEIVAGIVVCQAPGCARSSPAPFATMALRKLKVSIFDASPPSVRATPTGLASPGWHGGDGTLQIEADDNVGIRNLAVEGDGISVSRPQPCDDRRVIPCPSGLSEFPLSLRSMSDGSHAIRVTATDSAFNTQSTTVTIPVDNTPPTPPASLTLDGGDGWRTTNAFTITAQPPEDKQFAPIDRLMYEVCPKGNRAADKTGCTTGDQAGTRITDLKVPNEGEWTFRAWFRDSAGNASAALSRELTLRYDETVPTGAFAAPSADAPTQVTVAASDGVSGIGRGSIELRREGSDTWTMLPTAVVPVGVTATLPDESLRSGTYALRAAVVDNAGNARAIEQDAEGHAASVTLPVRLATRLRAGKAVRVRSKHGKRRNRLVARPRLSYGRALRLYGRLVGPDGKGMGDRTVTAVERTDAAGEGWRPVATLTTSRTGRFSVVVHSGPRRDIAFRYDGTGTVRGATAAVRMRVRAATSLRPSRRSIVNGEEVVFRGRLRGKPLPATSKLLALQAYTRGRWATFANPRANPKTGLWSYRYRFVATRGRVSYRIRAVVPKDGTYAFDTGRSHPVRIRVRGL